MALTNRDDLAERMNLLRSHGVTREPHLMTHESDGPWYYQQVDLGFNYRITDLQAALGVSQMERLDDFIVQRHELASYYDSVLADLPVTVPSRDSLSHSAFHLYVIRLQLDKINKSHHEVFCSMREQGIGVNVHYIPIHTQPFFQSMGFRNDDFPNAMAYYKEAISLPLFYSMSMDDVERVKDALVISLGLK